jgi:hypothetical protein
VDVTGKPINLQQLQAELATAGVSVPNGLGLSGAELYTFDASGQAQELPPSAMPVVQAHIAMRDKTDAEYATEFQDPNTTAVRRQEIRDMQAGLLPREQVPVEGPAVVVPPGPDLLAPIQAANSLPELREAVVMYLQAIA